jgi:uncharacterized membrane protein YagU involved in acid resistance
MIGVMLAVIYARLVFGRVPGPGVLQGSLYSIAPWLMAQVLVMPTMGMPPFAGSVRIAGASLVGHLMYGAVLGAIVGNAAAREPSLQGAHS